jgi:hypothetical protein
MRCTRWIAEFVYVIYSLRLNRCHLPLSSDNVTVALDGSLGPSGRYAAPS